MKKYNQIFTLISVVLLVNCTKPLPIDLPQAESKLVVSSQVIPGSVMIVTLSRSMDAKGFNEEIDTLGQDLLNQFLVESGVVTISYNGVVDTLSSIPGVPGVFLSVTTPQYLNTTYNLYAKDNKTGMEVTSSSFMLPIVTLDTVSASQNSSGKIGITNVNFGFKDPQGEENWYMVNFYALPDSGASSAGGFNLTQNDGTLKETIILTDKNFSSENFSATHKLTDWYEDSIVVSVSNISKEYYNYLNARLRSGGLFTSISREPVNHPTNIIDGYGFFTTHKPSIKLVPVN